MQLDRSAWLATWAKVWLACGLVPLFPASVVGWDYFTHILLHYDWSWSMVELLVLGGLSYGALLAGPTAIVVASVRLLVKPARQWMQVVVFGGAMTALLGTAFLALSIAEGSVNTFLVVVETTSLVVVGTALRSIRSMGRVVA